MLAVERVKLDKPEPVYNFTVKGPHTYFVLEVGVLVHNAGVCKPEDYPHLVEELQRGGIRETNRGFSLEESHEIIKKLSEAGVTDEQLKMMDELFAQARTVEVNGVKLMVVGDAGAEEFLVWRIADEGDLDSAFAEFAKNASEQRQRTVIVSTAVTGEIQRGWTGTREEQFFKETGYWHAEKAMGDRVKSPHVSTGGNLAPIVRTDDHYGPNSLLEKTVLRSDTIHLLQIPRAKLDFDYITNSETEILANAMREPLDPHLIIGLPNIFRDKAFTKRVRGD